MNKQKIFFLLSIAGILCLLLITQFQKPTTQGKISEIYYSQGKITLNLENQEPEIILFTNSLFLNLKKEQEIAIYGKEEIYKNKLQIIADKIICLNFC